MSISQTFLNGQLATADDLAPLAFAGYSHFTAMQVRDRSVRGLDVHLDRLRTASETLFGTSLPEDHLLAFLARAVELGPSDVSLTCYVTSRPGEFMADDGNVQLDVLIKVTDPANPPAGPLSLDLVKHERHLPHIKHVGEMAKTQFLRQARARGFDDAAFMDSSGRISEGTIWNLAFWDGRSVIWPEAEVLPGVTMQILRRVLRARGVPQVTRPMHTTDLTGHLAAVIMNSWTPAISLSRIGEQSLADGAEFRNILYYHYAAEPSIRL